MSQHPQDKFNPLTGIGNDPYAREYSANGPAKKQMDEMDRLNKSAQWELCRGAGFTVDIFHRDFHGVGAWIAADAIEAFLAAGPDLLSAAQRFLQISLNVNQFKDEQYEDAKRELQAAITKATGVEE